MSGLNQEFQVVVLAGGDGRRLKPLTEGIPKTLLPIANKPVLSYQLDFLSTAGFKEVILICNTSNSEAISQHVDLFKQEYEDITVHLLVCDDFMGSATCLLKIKDRIKNHLIVMSGDLIAEDQFLHSMADLHRARDAAVTILTFKEQVEQLEDSKEKHYKSDVIDYIGVDPKDNRILLTASSNILESNEQNLRIRKSILKRFPNFTLHTELRDAHFYMFSKWTLDVLEQNKQMIQSIKSHFIPFLVKSQFNKKKKQR